MIRHIEGLEISADLLDISLENYIAYWLEWKFCEIVKTDRPPAESGE